VKIVIYQHGGTPIEIEGERVRIMCGRDHFEMREQGGLLVRLEEHDGSLAIDLALFPAGNNGVRLKGGLQ
jgi:hypothetical protein